MCKIFCITFWYFRNFGNAWPSLSEITPFFLKISQRNSKFVILDYLGLPGHTHLKWQYEFEETFYVYLQGNNQLHPSRFPWDIAKMLQTCYCGYFGYAWLHTPKKILPTNEKVFCLSAGKKSTSSPMFLKEILHIYGYLFWILWACLATHTQNDSFTSYKTSIFICIPKINFIILFFLEILHFKKYCNLIGQ